MATFSKSMLIVMIFWFGGLSCSLSATEQTFQVFLFRHAEKMSTSDSDPALTETGVKRAEWLAQRLQDQNITRIYTTDYQRTRLTVLPTANALKLELTLYDPRKLAELAERIKQNAETVVVVGHSNTTPALVDFLGGEMSGEIDESEYDRFYQLSFDGEQVTTKIERSQPLQTPTMIKPDTAQ